MSKNTNKNSAPTTFPHGRNGKKIFSFVLICFLLIGLSLAVIAFLFGKNPNIKKGSEQWASQYHSQTYPYYGLVLVDDSDTICIMTEAGWEPVANVPSSEPNWFANGKKDARAGNWNEQSLFAARLLYLQNELNEQTKTEVLALGVGYFSNNPSDYSAEYWDSLENALISRLEGF